ncbi:LON peptidase substrate-binding domain-containing protein [Rhizobium sp. KVB221]|uniref:LON peptidase substrate-binding domain-containing protein n=1 Tax=Rhizobium setariae TaxID=2801340 RepID=A0A936YP37_9HYPH|nr:LON peptidase substrate-binding domain-containing protein [Rhizobium setariae]MBL0372257.1 LON peptidase substrate-binding domain-containing protein [Rhizobium setariae]
MQVGNARYLSESDLPDTIALFPLSGVLLLSGGHLPLNIYEPRYLSLIDDALKGNRLIGVIQPVFSETDESPAGTPELCKVGTIGRITTFGETGDGRYVIDLSGVCRFRMMDELSSAHCPYRRAKVTPFVADLHEPEDDPAVNRDALLGAFRNYLDSNKLEVDWDAVTKTSNRTLVNSLSMMAPFGPREKQALLETPDLKTRAETLVAMTEMVLARAFGDAAKTLQ